jgi:hypothetical protein
MGRSYHVCEKLGSRRAKFLSVFNGKDVALAQLMKYAATTSNEVYAQDVISKRVIARRNA